MKSRLLYILISGIIILAIFTGIFIWRNDRQKEIPKFNEKSFIDPISSKYIPTNADLVFHWKMDPNKIPNFVENYQDKINKDTTNKKIQSIIDTSFKLISLDFTKDISKWVGDYGSFAIFDTNSELLNDWLMVLEIKEDINIDEELESILEPNVVDKNMSSINNSNISVSKLNSEEINSNQPIYFSNKKEHIFISSNPKLISLSLSNKTNNTLIKKDQYKSIQLKNNINDGIFLLEMSPKKIFNIIGQGKDLLEINHTDKLISSINIGKKKLIFEGIIAYDSKYKRSINEVIHSSINIEKEFDLFDNTILIDNPKKYFTKHPSHPYKKLIASIIEQSIKSDYSNLLKIILDNTKGNLIWIKDKGWLTLTSKADTNKKEINDILKKENFLNSNLEFENKNLEVWSKITTNNNEIYELREKIEAILEETKDVYFWSQELSSILNFENKKILPNNIENEYTENINSDFDDIIKIHLGKKKTEEFLNNFYLYILLNTILGNKLDFPQNIDISVSIPTINYPDFVKFKIDLKTS